MISTMQTEKPLFSYPKAQTSIWNSIWMKYETYIPITSIQMNVESDWRRMMSSGEDRLLLALTRLLSVIYSPCLLKIYIKAQRNNRLKTKWKSMKTTDGHPIGHSFINKLYEIYKFGISPQTPENIQILMRCAGSYIWVDPLNIYNLSFIV